MQNLEFVVTRLEKIAARLVINKQNQRSINEALYRTPSETDIPKKEALDTTCAKKSGMLVDIESLLTDIEATLTTQEQLHKELQDILFYPQGEQLCASPHS
ncbi:hypothetical protein [Flavobacterium sp.]|uniref:hypothetical protein n=1 Tax=Flavobacterium sp. TaxID=239 RepID=UPI003D6BDBD4